MEIETPRGRVVKVRNGSARLEWNPNCQPKWQTQYTRAQKFVDGEVIRLCDPYTPFDTKMLALSAVLGTVIGSGRVVWNAPYAKFQYYGKVMISPTTGSSWARSGERKVLTSRNLNYNGAPKRGAFWFERMKADHKQAILDGAKRLAGGEK